MKMGVSVPSTKKVVVGLVSGAIVYAAMVVGVVTMFPPATAYAGALESPGGKNVATVAVPMGVLPGTKSSFARR